MDQLGQMIGVVRGASNTEIQDLFGKLVDHWRGFRLAGVVAESHGLPNRYCQAGYLRSLATGSRFSIFNDPGPGVADCHLDGLGAAAAAVAVERDIDDGCEVVVLNKFGKLEIAGEGLATAFRAAMAAHLPLLTSVSPAHDGAWRRFAGPAFAILPVDLDAIDGWLRAVIQTGDASC